MYLCRTMVHCICSTSCRIHRLDQNVHLEHRLQFDRDCILLFGLSFRNRNEGWCKLSIYCILVVERVWNLSLVLIIRLHLLKGINRLKELLRNLILRYCIRLKLIQTMVEQENQMEYSNQFKFVNLREQRRCLTLQILVQIILCQLNRKEEPHLVANQTT